MSYRVLAQDRADRYRVSVKEYAAYQRDGFLVVRDLVPAAEVTALGGHALDLLYGRASVSGVEPPPDGASEEALLHARRVRMIIARRAAVDAGVRHTRLT